MPYNLYEWVGTMYSVARTYSQYLECRKSRQRFLMLRKQEREGRVKREKAENCGYFYHDYKVKHTFYVENLLVSDNERQYLQNPEQHMEIENPEGSDLI